MGIVGSPRGQSKDVSLVADIKEWTGESKGKPVQEFLMQIETLAKVSGWSSQDKALIVKAKLHGLAPFPKTPSHHILRPLSNWNYYLEHTWGAAFCTKETSNQIMLMLHCMPLGTHTPSSL
jgi:hypothetical protein